MIRLATATARATAAPGQSLAFGPSSGTLATPAGKWNRQARHEVLIDVEDVALGHDTKMRWNDPTQWVWSENPTHTAIVSADTSMPPQEVFAGSQRAAVRRNRTRHHYVLSGLVRCVLCGRRMQGSWTNGQPYYRCKFPAEYAVSENQHAKTV